MLIFIEYFITYSLDSIQFKKNEVIKSENESPTSTGTVASQACLLM